MDFEPGDLLLKGQASAIFTPSVWNLSPFSLSKDNKTAGGSGLVIFLSSPFAMRASKETVLEVKRAAHSPDSRHPAQPPAMTGRSFQS